MDDFSVEAMALPKVKIRLRDVLAVVNGVAFLLMASGRVAREVRRWQEERRRWRRTARRRPVPRTQNWPKERAEKQMGVVTLYRPVGQKEYEWIRDSGFKAFPPRLPEQPLFYPVLNEEYATRIARDWNTKDPFSDFTGIVLKFEVHAEFLAHYKVHQVGGSQHKEYWIPAEDLNAFNQAIVGTIEKVSEFILES